MKPRRFGVLALLALACASGSFVATYAWQPRASATDAPARLGLGWLGLSAAQVRTVTPVVEAFAAERAPLESALAAEREKLVRLFDSPDTTDAAILHQVEAVIAAHDALERRVAEHVVALRPHLSPEQQGRLFSRLAEGVRLAEGARWRHGQSRQTEGDRRGAGPPGERGGGPPAGRGRNRGGSP